ncbi:unnamed protein product [Schistocephalus solidus]|uniref:Uncharacterized protein n=1 Tax=Schistocephalus solidus TaxID=70667 RepID=A0A183T6R8_SCHSO|nr:unnamed protein product [Schistocephalus solidus]
MDLFGHRRIHASGIHRKADNTDTPCKPSAPATATPTTTNDIPPSLSRFLLPTLHPQLQLMHRPGWSPANPSHGAFMAFPLRGIRAMCGGTPRGGSNLRLLTSLAFLTLS